VTVGPQQEDAPRPIANATIAPAVRPSVAQALRQRDLVIFVVSRFFSGVAMTLLRATFSWQIFSLTGSAFALGMIGLVQFIPTFVLSLLSGAVADRYDRRRIIQVTLVGSFACSALLYLTTRHGHIGSVLLYSLILAAATATAFEGPARAALLPTLVPRPLLPAAVTLNSGVQNLAWVTGPVVMGFVIAAYGVAAAYLIHMGVIVLAFVALAFVRSRRPAGALAVVSLAAIREGIAFVRRRRVVLGAMTLDMFAVIFGGATALLPIYATEILNVGARGYGLLSSALQIGTVVMSLVLLGLPPIHRPGRAVLAAVSVYGAATILFGLSRTFSLSIGACIVAGMADQISVVSRAMIIQLATPDELRGRVSSVNLVFIGASNQLGAVESGFVAALTGPVFSVVSGGIGALVVLFVVAILIPELRHYRIEHSDRQL